MIKSIKRYSARRMHLTNSEASAREALRSAEEIGLELNGLRKSARRERVALNGARNNEVITHYRALTKILRRLELIGKSKLTNRERSFVALGEKLLESKRPIKEQDVVVAFKILERYNPGLAEKVQTNMTQRGYKGKLFNNKNRVK